MSKILAYDKVSLTASSRRVLPTGYVVSRVRLARIGIFQYKAKEIGLGGDPERVVNVLRTEDALFGDENMKTFKNLPLTINHVAMIDETNIEQHEQGSTTGELTRVGDYLETDLMFRTEKAKSQMDSEVSIGFYASYDYTSGVYDGVEYEAVQTAIEGNHIALVPKGRCGAGCRVLDNDTTGDENMATKKLIRIGNTDCEIDENVAERVQFALDRIVEENDKTVKERDSLQAQLDAANDTIKNKETEITSLKENNSVEALDAKVAERVDLVQRAQKVSKDFKFDGKDSETIRKEIVEASVDGIDLTNKSSAYVEARFDALVEASVASGDSEDNDDLGTALKKRARQGGGDENMSLLEKARAARTKNNAGGFIGDKLGA